MDATRAARAELRRANWVIEALSDDPPSAPLSLAQRLEQLEAMRRLAFAAIGVAYPSGPTPRVQRRQWAVESIE